MKKSILKSLLVAFVAVCFNMSFVAAQQLKELPAGPHGGKVFNTGVNNQKIEMKIDGNKVSFFVLTEKGENAKLKAAAATAAVLFDYNGEQTAVSKQVTINSKNKFETVFPESSIKVNFIAFHANFNGDILEARYIFDNPVSPSVPASK